MRKFGALSSDTPVVKRLSVVLVVLALATTGCQAADAATVPEVKPAVIAPSSQAVIVVTPAPDATKVDPNARVEVRATAGRLRDVRVRDQANHRVKGSLDPAGVWRSSEELLSYATTYTVTAQALDAEGRGKVVQTTFRTVKPKTRLTTSISPIAGQTVGVGMPIIVRLSGRVTDRAAVERALSVESSREVSGSWAWTSDRELHWRPKAYWPQDTDVAVKVRLNGVQAGAKVWGAENRTVKFTVGSAMVSTVNLETHTMTVRRNGVVIKEIPITTGKEGFRTRGGVKVIVSKERKRVMDATTIDIPEDSAEYYRLEVEYAMRLTWSGEFIHAAPWSVSHQGRDDVSHGCTGMSTAAAEWLYGQSKVGDVVEYKGFSRGLEPGNGWTDWNVSWKKWTEGSAL